MILEKCIVYWKYILKTWRGVSFLNMGSGIMRSVFTKTALVAARRVDWKGETGGKVVRNTEDCAGDTHRCSKFCKVRRAMKVRQGHVLGVRH